ncbi:MAG TPA: hypothetical protein VEI94_16795, partial [Candidatus Bathyarchaeia archaeon]|nr:hypothetical protein [Candidatus Bathyarchaeia archaeon]
VGYRVCKAARARGVILRPLGDVVVLMPPLTLTRPEADLLVDVVAQSIEEVTSRELEEGSRTNLRKEPGKELGKELD